MGFLTSYPEERFMRSGLVAVLCLVLLAACSHKAPNSGPERHYPLTGKVVALNPKEHTALIDAAAIPNFMEAMTMDYPIKSASEFSSLHVGDRIDATVNVHDDGLYDLSNIKVESSGK